MTPEHEAFGLRLKTHRERCGITLETIADSTKIKRSLLQALERGDVAHFPLGIFRRAYVRSYANAIGLPAEHIVAEFVQLFPEPGETPRQAPVVRNVVARPVLAPVPVPAPAPVPALATARPVLVAAPEPDSAESPLRLTLAPEGRLHIPHIPALRERTIAATIDGLSILALALTLWILRASSLSVSLGLSAFGFVIARAFSSGRSGVEQWIKPGHKEAPAEEAPLAAGPVAVLQARGARRGGNRPGNAQHKHGSGRRERRRLRRAGL